VAPPRGASGSTYPVQVLLLGLGESVVDAAESDHHVLPLQVADMVVIHLPHRSNITITGMNIFFKN